MKKLLMMSLMLISFGLVFTSCSDDDDDVSIVGTWFYTEGDSAFDINATPSIFGIVIKDYLIEEWDVIDYSHKVVITNDSIESFYDNISEGAEYYTYNDGIITVYEDKDHYYSEPISVSKHEMIVTRDYTNFIRQENIIDEIFALYDTELEGINKAEVKVNKVLMTDKYIRQ